ncbi:hypothetical protein ACSQ6I_07070 [Anabaena sp. WFMT]
MPESREAIAQNKLFGVKFCTLKVLKVRSHKINYFLWSSRWK